MSGGDPFDPFGQNDRTIVRPNPGGRQPAPGGQAPNPGGAQPAQMPPAQAQPASGFVAPAPAAPSGPLVTPGTNPLIIAAGPLLDLLGRLRNSLTQASFAQNTAQKSWASKRAEFGRRACADMLLKS